MIKSLTSALSVGRCSTFLLPILFIIFLIRDSLDGFLASLICEKSVSSNPDKSISLALVYFLTNGFSSVGNGSVFGKVSVDSPASTCKKFSLKNGLLNPGFISSGRLLIFAISPSGAGKSKELQSVSAVWSILLSIFFNLFAICLAVVFLWSNGLNFCLIFLGSPRGSWNNGSSLILSSNNLGGGSIFPRLIASSITLDGVCPVL